MKRFSLAGLLATALSSLGCAAQLATLPPSDHYTMVEGPTPQLDDDQRHFLEQINQELARVGQPAGVAGSYEMNEAAVLANVALGKIWSGSGRAITRSADLTQETKGTETTEERRDQESSSSSKGLGVSDEEDDNKLTHIHAEQHLIARGALPARSAIWDVAYAETRINDDDLKKLVAGLNPKRVRGELVFGVAVVPVGDADRRIFAAVCRDRQIEIEAGPPRSAAPGSTFSLSGRAVDRSLPSLSLGLLTPEGNVARQKLLVDGAGHFAAQITLPNLAGLYVLELKSPTIPYPLAWVPIFVGVPPAPWPPSADPIAKDPPIDGTRTLAQRLLKVLADFRKDHRLPPVAVDPQLSAFAKAEATELGKAEDGSNGPNGPQGLRSFEDEQTARARAAGLDPTTLQQFWQVDSVDNLPTVLSRITSFPLVMSALGSPTLQALGIGVALVPNEVRKSDDYTGYAFAWVTRDPTPPKDEAAEAAAPADVPAPAPANPPAAPAPAPSNAAALDAGPPAPVPTPDAGSPPPPAPVSTF